MCIRDRLQVLAPLGDDDDHLGVLQRPPDGCFVMQLRVPAPGVLDSLRIGRDHVGTQALKPHRNIKRGRISNVVGLGLERQAQNGNLLCDDVSVERLDNEVDDALTLAKVDGIDFFEERQGVPDAQFLSPCPERSDVLGQAATAEANPSVCLLYTSRCV